MIRTEVEQYVEEIRDGRGYQHVFVRGILFAKYLVVLRQVNNIPIVRVKYNRGCFSLYSAGISLTQLLLEGCLPSFEGYPFSSQSILSCLVAVDLMF